MQLTELGVRALKASDRYESYWDTVTPGFCVRVGRRSKTFCVVRGKTRERLTIGRFPDISIAAARAEAKRLLAAEPTIKVASVSFALARDEFLEEHYANAAPQTKYNVSKLLKRHFKAIEQRSLTDLDDTHIKKCLDALSATPSEQLHAFRAVRCFLRWCVRPPRRYIKHSPMEGYEAPGRDRKGTRVLTDKELLAVWKASNTYPHNVLRLMILWGTRNTETCVLERAWRSNSGITIPGQHTKNGRDHAIPLLPLALSVLDAMPAPLKLKGERAGEHYFPSRWGDTHLSVTGLAKAYREVKEQSGTSGWQIRDLRRTFRSNMARLKVPREVCEVLINHAPPVLDEIYDRYDRLEEKHNALQRYEEFPLLLIAQNNTTGS